MSYKYRNVRVVCKGSHRGCEHCKEIPISEGYCKLCRRPLWKNIGDSCNTIIAYYDGELKQGKKENEKVGVDIICKECNSITTI